MVLAREVSKSWQQKIASFGPYGTYWHLSYNGPGSELLDQALLVLPMYGLESQELSLIP